MKLDQLKLSSFFKEVTLKKWEYLFSEWDTDMNLYIIYDGEISIEKNTSSEDQDSKCLALLGIWNIIWESSFHADQPKEVSAIAARDTILLFINAKEGFDKLLQEQPKTGIEILKSIIHISNIRLLRSNKQVTAHYEIHKAINNLESLDTSCVLGLVDTFGQIIKCDSCIYLEKNTFVEDFIEYKYNSRSPWKLQDIPIEVQDTEITISDIENTIPLEKYSEIGKISIWKEIYGYLVVTRNSGFFEEHEKKMLAWVCNAFVGVIRQKKIQEEEKNKNYMRGV